MDIVVSGGSDPDRPIRAPKDNKEFRLLQLIAVGVFLAAAGTGYTGWTVYQQALDNRITSCAYYTSGSPDGPRSYDDMERHEKPIVDRLDCDVPGRWPGRPLA